MAVITNSTFDPLKARCNVRLQQGVPIVDADWNEMDDIRKFELRAFLKWHVGDGIPNGSDGFRIDAAPGPVTDDFIIRCGIAAAPAGATDFFIGLENTGRCIADGLDVIIQSDVNYKAQPLYAASGPDGTQIQPIPVISGNVAIYLDISERLVTAAEDPSLVLPGLGTESCARMKRVWCVRTRQGTAAPVLNDPDYVAGHAYYLLAVLTRKLSAPNVAAPIQPGDIADKRHKGLTTAALESRVSNLETLLLLPAFGTPGTQLIPSTQFVGQAVALNGRNLTVGTPRVWVGNVSAALSGAPTSTQLNFTVPTLAAGSYSVSLSTDGGGPITATDVLTVKPPVGPPPPPPPANAPTLDATTPFTPKTQARGQNIVITGTNFNQANLTVWFGVTQAVVVNSSAVQITATVPSMAAGNYTISVDTAAGAVSSTAPFPVT